ncbi:MAG: type II secretion system F family protein, partial [Thermodesulfovibrionaceae bacterium]
ISMIKIGEKTGNLKEAFANIANYISFNIKFKEEIKNAMIYPVFLIVASFIALLGIFKIIIPRFYSVFAEGFENLPFLSKTLYSISSSINLKNLFLLTVGVGLLVITVRNRLIYLKILDFFIFFPFFKRFFFELELSRFCYTMSSMLKSGVEFINALNYSAEIIKSENIKKAIKQTIPLIKEGKSISKVFSEIDFLPSIFKGTIKVGEESGRLVDMFFELYQYFDERFKNSIKRFLNILEPMIITFMGIIIGLIVLSLILTIMSVSNIRL